WSFRDRQALPPQARTDEDNQCPATTKRQAQDQHKQDWHQVPGIHHDLKYAWEGASSTREFYAGLRCRAYTRCHERRHLRINTTAPPTPSNPRVLGSGTVSKTNAMSRLWPSAGSCKSRQKGGGWLNWPLSPKTASSLK